MDIKATTILPKLFTGYKTNQYENDYFFIQLRVTRGLRL